MQDAEEAVFPSAEWEIGHGRGYADIDSDIAGGGFVAEATGCSAARGKERRLIPVLSALEAGQSFIQITSTNHTQDRAKDFRVSDLASRRDIVENRRLHKVPCFILRDLRIASVKQNL